MNKKLFIGLALAGIGVCALNTVTKPNYDETIAYLKSTKSYVSSTIEMATIPNVSKAVSIPYSVYLNWKTDIKSDISSSLNSSVIIPKEDGIYSVTLTDFSVNVNGSFRTVNFIVEKLDYSGKYISSTNINSIKEIYQKYPEIFKMQRSCSTVNGLGAYTATKDGYIKVNHEKETEYTTYLCMYDYDNNLLWKKATGEKTFYREFVEVSDGFIAINNERELTRFDNKGNVIWSNKKIEELGETGDFYSVSSITDCGDGIIAINGSTIFKFDYNGNCLWHIDTHGLDHVFYDNGSVVAHGSNSNGDKIFKVRTSDGTIVEEYCKGDVSQCTLRSVAYKDGHLYGHYRDESNSNEHTDMIADYKLIENHFIYADNLTNGKFKKTYNSYSNFSLDSKYRQATLLECVEDGKDGKENVKIIPDKGYKIETISINGEQIEFTPSANGSYTLEKFTNVKSDIVVSATFKEDLAQTVVNVVNKSSSGKDLGKYTLQGYVGKKILIEPKDIEGYTKPMSINTEVKENTTITFTYEPIEYTIAYELNGGSADNKTKYTVEDSVTFTNPAKVGYTFANWTDEKGNTITKIDAGTTGNKTLTANWSVNPQKINVKYVSTTGKELGTESYNAEYDETKEVKAPEKAGYKTPVSQTIKVDGDKNVTFTYEPVVYNIEYALDGGQTKNVATYTIENAITLSDATKTGYTFVNWTDENGNVITKIDAGTTGNKKIKANWNANAQVINVKYISETGKELGTEKYDVKYDDTKEIEAIEIEGYETPEAQTVEVNGDMNVTFTYKAIEYNIEYVLDGGETENPAIYIIEDKIILGKATKEGYVFVEWQDEEGNKVETIEEGTMGDIKLTAIWKEEEQVETGDISLFGTLTTFFGSMAGALAITKKRKNRK